MNVLFSIPSYRGIIYPEFKESLERCANVLHNFGHKSAYTTYKGNALIGLVRANIVRDFLETKANVLIMLDDDLSFPAESVKKIIDINDDIVCGVYRVKNEIVTFPAILYRDNNGDLIMRDDGCIKASRIPMGFFKITRGGAEKIIKAYPERAFKDTAYLRQIGKTDSYDIFPIGVNNGAYEGEDTGFCRLWEAIGGEIWVYPNITFNHYSENGKYYRGNYYNFIKEKMIETKTQLEKAA